MLKNYSLKQKLTKVKVQLVILYNTAVFLEIQILISSFLFYTQKMRVNIMLSMLVRIDDIHLETTEDCNINYLCQKQ